MADEQQSSFLDVTCCNPEQWFFICTLACFLVAQYLVWNSKLARPFKLFSTFLHEMGHAIMVWLWCSKVSYIRVNQDLSGETGVARGRCARGRCAKMCMLNMVAPAGYLGSTAWACAILVCSADKLATEVIGVTLLVVVAVGAAYAFMDKNSEGFRTMLPLCIFFGVFLLAGVVLSLVDGLWRHGHLFLEAVLLLIGGLNILDATHAIWSTTVAKTIQGSDSWVCATQIAPGKDCSCCQPRCVGAIYLVISTGAIGLSIYFSMAISTSLGPPVSAGDVVSNDFNYAPFIPGPAVLLAAILFVLYHSPFAPKVAQWKLKSVQVVRNRM